MKTTPIEREDNVKPTILWGPGVPWHLYNSIVVPKLLPRSLCLYCNNSRRGPTPTSYIWKWIRADPFAPVQRYIIVGGSLYNIGNPLYNIGNC